VFFFFFESVRQPKALEQLTKLSPNIFPQKWLKTMSVDDMSVNEKTIDKMSVSEMIVDKMSVDENASRQNVCR
jgi:hypothetical protein